VVVEGVHHSMHIDITLCGAPHQPGAVREVEVEQSDEPPTAHSCRRWLHFPAKETHSGSRRYIRRNTPEVPGVHRLSTGRAQRGEQNGVGVARSTSGMKVKVVGEGTGCLARVRCGLR